MKTKGVIASCLMSMVALWGSTACALFGFGPTTFQEAYSKGAKARIEFRVVDDTGCPVKDANVNVTTSRRCTIWYTVHRESERNRNE